MKKTQRKKSEPPRVPVDQEGFDLVDAEGFALPLATADVLIRLESEPTEGEDSGSRR